jgi:amidase
MDDILVQPVRQLAEAIRTGQLTSVQLTRSCLDRIETVNPALNAVVHLEAETAMKHAERADLALKSGETPGRLFGVPMTIKDSLDTFDMITTWGTTGRREFRPGADATCVERLRNEGAVLMGKTNTPEFTLAFKTDNAIFGRTSNPYNTDRTPGGSSGGAAAIIAAGGSPFDIGTDTGGSIRLPSHFCGITGIKPTTGRVPCTGNALPSSGLLATLSQPGPMARHVDDLIYLLEIIQGPDNVDPHARSMPWTDPYDIDIKRLKIGYHTDNGISTPDDAIVSAINEVKDLLSDEDFRITEARPTGVEMSSFVFNAIWSADNGEMVDELLEDCRTKELSSLLSNSVANRPPEISAREFAQAIALWHNYQSSMLGYFDNFDLLLSPVNARTAIPHDQPEAFPDYTYTAAYNLTGWPAVVIRAGTDPKGLPVGLQIIAAPGREDQCLALAAWLETRLGPFEGPNLQNQG